MKLAPNEFYAIRFRNSDRFFKTSSGKFTWFNAGHAKLALHSYIRKNKMNVSLYNYSENDKTRWLNYGFILVKDGMAVFLFDSILYEVAEDELYPYFLNTFFEVVRVTLRIKE